ncbi:YaaC family protein [Streptomyces sp. NPDC052036]|uniref:YaaC family protein n=1 Tax=Streptomyces sp. NPDC052036 TaxID=3155171 RepID=UPI00342D6ACC
MTRSYAGGRYFLPALPPMKRVLHPLMAWWTVLYTLSMLARYQPPVWSTLISVDNSTHAVPIERLLERVISHVPSDRQKSHVRWPHQAGTRCPPLTRRTPAGPDGAAGRAGSGHARR